MQITTFWVLGSAGTPLSEKGKKTCLLRARETPNLEKIKGRVDLISVIAVLVATVTFAAGLTVPGGFNSPDNINGSLTMSGGFNSSNNAPAIPAVARDIAYYGTSCAHFLVGAAIFQMSLAFISATYLIVSDISWVAVLVLVMGILYLFCFVVLFMACFFPFGVRHPIFHCLCQVVIPSMLFFTQPFNYTVDDQKQESFPVKKDKHEESQPSNKDRQEGFQQKKV